MNNKIRRTDLVNSSFKCCSRINSCCKSWNLAFSDRSCSCCFRTWVVCDVSSVCRRARVASICVRALCQCGLSLRKCRQEENTIPQPGLKVRRECAHQQPCHAQESFGEKASFVSSRIQLRLQRCEIQDAAEHK